MTSDVRILFMTRSLRLFAYGFISIVLALYLTELRFSIGQVGALFTFTLIGDAAVSLWVTSRADRIGRQRMLIVGAVLMALAGLVFALSRDYTVLLLAATLGVISPSGNEVGPFLAIEQASLAEVIKSQERVKFFAWYNLAGSFTTAIGALCAGFIIQGARAAGAPVLLSYRFVVIGYAFIGLLLIFLFRKLSKSVEATSGEDVSRSVRENFMGLHKSKKFVLKLSALFSLDAFAGGFVVQSIVAYWFTVRFGTGPAVLGGIFFGANVLAGLSALFAVRIANRIGLLRTMVVTHIPSNVLLLLVPLMPNLQLAMLVLLLRFSISQMDVPTRQAFTIAMVAPDERSAAAGITGIARTLGASISPVLAGMMLGVPALAGAPFILAGGLKIAYDLMLYFSFKSIQTEHE